MHGNVFLNNSLSTLRWGMSTFSSILKEDIQGKPIGSSIEVKPQSAGFEPAREYPNRFRVYRLNHSTTTARLCNFCVFSAILFIASKLRLLVTFSIMTRYQILNGKKELQFKIFFLRITLKSQFINKLIPNYRWTSGVHNQALVRHQWQKFTLRNQVKPAVGRIRTCAGISQ